MKIRLSSTLLILLQFLCLYACVEPYDVTYNLNADLLTVEGFVTDQPGSPINISISRSLDKNYYAVPLTGCKVKVKAGDGNVIIYQEVTDGVYAPPSSFSGKEGQTYQLHFQTPDGKVYESSKEPLSTVPAIKKIYQQFDKNGILDKTGKRVIGSTVDVYVDFDDPKDIKNYYLWRWKRYEAQNICITCEGGLLNFYGGIGRCDKINARNPPTYDYQCNQSCWDVFYNDDVNILADDFTNGKSVEAQLIAKVPFHTYTGSLLEIEQVGISRDAYLYYKLLRDQNQTTGTLTDTPPAPIIGNIQNINDPNDKVVGYFGAASSKIVNYWVDRSIYNGAILVPILGREANLEPSTGLRPPSYPCVMSKFRTPIRPQNWR